MRHRLYGLRGSAYVAKMKHIMAEDGPIIKTRFQAIVKDRGRFTPTDLGLLANEFCLPLTVLDDYLPEITGHAYPTGTWERLRQRGCKAKDIGVVWND